MYNIKSFYFEIKPIIHKMAPIVNFLPFNNFYRKHGAHLDINKCILINSRIICHGRNNTIIFAG